MALHHFSDNQIWPLYIGLALLAASVVCFVLDNIKWSLVLLFLGALGLGFFIANLDNFLLLWDEQYHALVAKHLRDSPFDPTLYERPLLPYDYRNWTGNSIWLHKQPLFLWQIALSLKLFGLNSLAVRLPSVLLHALAVLCIYRIGKIAVNARTGYLAALFFAAAYYPLELVAGRFSTDHNDVSFLFYITASFWAWFEYRNSGKQFYLLLIGLFSGCAVLVKWLVGLLVYASWFLSLGSQDAKHWLRWRSYKPLLIALGICLLVFVPWQIYILHAFPLEANYEFAYNTRHFFEQLENHGGSFWYHFEMFRTIYGTGVLVPILYGFGLLLLLKHAVHSAYRTAILSAVLIPYVFYAFAATKMPSFTIIVSPFFFLGLACLVDVSFNILGKKLIRKKMWIAFQLIALISVCAFLLDLGKIQNYHTEWKPNDNCNRAAELAQMEFIGRIKSLPKQNSYVVFDADIRMNGHIATMFYTDVVAYDFIPSAAQITAIRAQNYKIVVCDKGNLPIYMLTDKDILKVQL
jgi:4-amino-4-deoxy-L-arabinose transferase